MKVFKDINGRAWSISITLPVLERVKEMTGLQLMQLIDSAKSNAMESLSDPVELLRVLVAVLEPEKQGVTLDVFKVAISDGDVLEKAADALLDELVDFLPQRQKSLKRTAISKLRGVKPQQYDLAEKMLLAATMKLDQSIELLKSVDFSGNSAASQASTPVLTDLPT